MLGDLNTLEVKRKRGCSGRKQRPSRSMMKTGRNSKKISAPSEQATPEEMVRLFEENRQN